jgi:hypothetical protein
MPVPAILGSYRAGESDTPREYPRCDATLVCNPPSLLAFTEKAALKKALGSPSGEPA